MVCTLATTKDYGKNDLQTRTVHRNLNLPSTDRLPIEVRAPGIQLHKQRLSQRAISNFAA